MKNLFYVAFSIHLLFSCSDSNSDDSAVKDFCNCIQNDGPECQDLYMDLQESFVENKNSFEQFAKEAIETCPGCEETIYDFEYFVNNFGNPLGTPEIPHRNPSFHDHRKQGENAVIENASNEIVYTLDGTELKTGDYINWEDLEKYGWEYQDGSTHFDLFGTPDGTTVQIGRSGERAGKIEAIYQNLSF